MGTSNSQPVQQKSNYDVNADDDDDRVDFNVDYETVSPRFSVDDVDEIKQGVEHLNEHGYAVFSNVLTRDQAKHSVDLLWKFFEDIDIPEPIRRNDPKTWDPWPGSSHIGLLNTLGIGQSEFLWFVRGNPNIKKVFSNIWNSNELFVSFDGAGGFRNWHINPKWKTTGGWYHCDQNPIHKPDRCSIQGLVSLTDSDETTGGLVIVPGSHKHFAELKKYTKSISTLDYVGIPSHCELLRKLRPRLIKCQAGDLVVWDSRCIHCNTPAFVDKKPEGEPEFLRVATYICMSPASMFVPDEKSYKNIEEFRQKRELYVRMCITCPHWPLQLFDTYYEMEKKSPLKLNAFQRSLILGTNVDAENGTEEFIY